MSENENMIAWYHWEMDNALRTADVAIDQMY